MKNAYVKKTFLFTKYLDLLTPELLFEQCIYQEHIQNIERDWKNSVCIKANYFAKSVNF